MDQKTSILIQSQVPDFVKDEYPLFVNFLEAYYEFLENKQGTQLNDLLNQSKKLSTIFDVDKSIDEFKVQFFNTFANYLPLNAHIDPAFLIKNILPLYKAKGSEKSFELLFRLLFGVDVSIRYPRNNILIASDGKWRIDSAIKISTDASSVYVGDGETKEFVTLKCRCPITNQVLHQKLDVYVNDVLKIENDDYIVLKEYDRIVFNSAPENNSIIEVYYQNIDSSLLVNRKFVGKDSGSSAVSELIQSRLLNNRIIYEIFVDLKSVVGEFKVGEKILTSVFIDGTLVNVILNPISELKELSIVNPGSGYSIGDRVIINSPDAEVVPQAFVSKVARGGIKSIIVLDGGAGFNLYNRIFVNGFGLPLTDIYISSLLTNSAYPVFSANTYTIFSNFISDIDIANTAINAIDYGFESSANANSTILHVLSDDATFTNLGQILGVDIQTVNLTITQSPVISADPAKIEISGNEVNILDFGSLGKLKIVSSGENYTVGDEINFVNQLGSWGSGAFAEITEVDEFGGIIKVEFVPDKISGTANVTNSSYIVNGKSTLFNVQLAVNDKIRINGEEKTVTQINSNTSLHVDSVFSSTANNKVIRLFGKNLVGGQGYTQDILPNTVIVSSTGSNGNVIVTSIMGSGDRYESIYDDKSYGGIEEITISNYGRSIVTIPEIDLSESGDGNAIAVPKLVSPFETYPGRWINSDGILSSDYMRLQNRDYYQKYSYVISSIIEFSKYKDIIKNLLHPVGMKIYAELTREETLAFPQMEAEFYNQSFRKPKDTLITFLNLVFNTDKKIIEDPLIQDSPSKHLKTSLQTNFFNVEDVIRKTPKLNKQDLFTSQELSLVPILRKQELVIINENFGKHFYLNLEEGPYEKSYGDYVETGYYNIEGSGVIQDYFPSTHLNIQEVVMIEESVNKNIEQQYNNIEDIGIITDSINVQLI